MNSIIDLAVKSTFEEFKRNPFEYSQNEREAQFNLFNKLNHMVTGVIKVHRNEPKPPFVNLEARRVRVEYDLGEFIPDIVIFKKDITNTKETDIDDIEAFIEVKVGWDCGAHCFSKNNTKVDGFYKDILRLQEYPDKGYIVYYIADILEQISPVKKSNCRDVLKEYSDQVDFNHIYIVFRDKIISGTDIDNDWK